MNNAKKGYPFGASLEATAGSTFVRGCARVSIAQKRYEYSFSSFAASLGGKIARFFRSATSRCASTDFTFSAFGAMAGVVREDDGVGGAGGDGGRALLSFGFGKKGSGGDSRGRNSNGQMGELPLFPLLIRRDGGGRFAFPSKGTTHDLSHDAAIDTCRSGRAWSMRSEV